MNKNISFLKKLKMYSQFKKMIKENRLELENRFNLRIDEANRLYTVINVPPDVVGEAYSLKKSDIDRIAENFIKEYSSELGIFLNSKGLNELYDFYDLKKVDKYSYLVVVGFSMFRSDERRARIFKIWIPIISALVILGTLFFALR
jgi:hypothetical protein